MEWYPKVLRLVNSAFPTLRLTRKHNLPLLTHARKRTLSIQMARRRQCHSIFLPKDCPASSNRQ